MSKDGEEDGEEVEEVDLSLAPEPISALADALLATASAAAADVETSKEAFGFVVEGREAAAGAMANLALR